MEKSRMPRRTTFKIMPQRARSNVRGHLKQCTPRHQLRLCRQGCISTFSIWELMPSQTNMKYKVQDSSCLNIHLKHLLAGHVVRMWPCPQLLHWHRSALSTFVSCTCCATAKRLRAWVFDVELLIGKRSINQQRLHSQAIPKISNN